jgi:2-polyprenyl-3-methyl-5-hydroxy-6-metoxy-1,4-benzoquinol methylase
MNCGFVTYPELVSKAEDIKQFYREEYRLPPNVNNLYTGQKKLHYHDSFLRPTVWKEWTDRKLTNPVMFDVGAAFGMFIDYLMKVHPKGVAFGSELTLSYRRNAYHHYGKELTEDFDTSREYDLIACYKVLEHIPNAGEELDKYRKHLKKDGYLYISVPTWFHSMTNFGLDGFDLDYYYHKNHINVWSRKLFATLLAKHGFEIVHKNTTYYDFTVLCKKNISLMEKEREFEEPAHIIDLMSKIKTASTAFDKNDFEGAIKAFPCFPGAHIAGYENTRAKLHREGFEAIKEKVIDRALECCPNSVKIRGFAGDLNVRYNKFKEAIDCYNQALELSPLESGMLFAIIHIHTCLAQKDPDNAVEHYSRAREVALTVQQSNLQHAPDATTLLMSHNAKLPMPSEKT